MKHDIAVIDLRQERARGGRYLLIGTLVALLMMLVAFATAAHAQVSSHAPTGIAPASAPASAPQVATPQISDRPVAKVNGAVLTDRDLLREMYAIFPYAKQHNGFPKSQEAAIRQGALEMIIFEELVYQDAERRKVAVPATRVNQAEQAFRGQFSTPDEYQAYMQSEMHGSRQALRKQIERSILIDQELKAEVDAKSSISLAELQAYYQKNSARFQQPESFAFQSISILPPRTATPEQQKEGKKRADEALRQAKATKTYQDFGLLAEKISEDDFRVNMGDHKPTPREQLPPQVVKALSTMPVGQVSGLIQIENAYTIVRLTSHTLARKQPFSEVKPQLKDELQKSKYEQLRAGLAKRLRANAKIEVL